MRSAKIGHFLRAFIDQKNDQDHLRVIFCNGIGVVPYSPLARGVLTGKYSVDAAPDKNSRAGRNDKRMMQTEWRPESLKLAQDIKAHAERVYHPGEGP